MRNLPNKGIILAGMACGLAACGGGGGGSLSSTPPPTPTPTPTSSAAVRIFPSPVPGEYVSVGVSSASSLEDGDDRLTNISSADANQVHIRYNAAGYYEIELPGGAWDRLVHYKGLVNPTTENNYFQPASVAQNRGFLTISNSRDKGYLHSEMGAWGTDLVAAAPFGYVAFGTPTPASSIPITGSASYAGVISGTADIMFPDNLYGGSYPAGVEGNIALNFNFGAGTLGGSMNVIINEGMGYTDLGSFAFADTVYSAGSPTYSGRFASQLAGSNYFLGRFTGPNAQETIGAWALPFLYPADGKVHQAIGAFIAKQP